MTAVDTGFEPRAVGPSELVSMKNRKHAMEGVESLKISVVMLRLGLE